MMKKRKSPENEEPKKDYLFLLAVFILIIILLVSIYYSVSDIKTGYVEKTPSFVSMDGATLVTMKLPAVNQEGVGVTTILSVEAMPGNGRVLLDIDDLLFWADTEHSMRKARIVAGNISGIDVKKYDIIYNIDANASLIGGESAGAALAVATIAALQNKSLKENVMITGTINHDGSIGPISGVLEKAKASKEIGVNLFLVPLLQSVDVVYETVQHCEKFGWTEICTTEQIPQKVNVGDKAEIRIEEVGTIDEALKYFFE